MQCSACQRVISDSNQLCSAVAELNVLVLDAVIGVTAGAPSEDDSASVPLHCSGCGAQLGRQYRKAPRPSLAEIVHSDGAPRYALSHAALSSYVLGSAALHNSLPPPHACGDGGGAAANGGANADNSGDSSAPPPPPMAGQEEAWAGAAADVAAAAAAAVGARENAGGEGVREELTQLMRVVLALDERLRGVEEARGAAARPNGHAEEGAARKRAR